MASTSDRNDVTELPLGMVGRTDPATACHTCVFYSRPEVGSRVLPHVEQVLRSHRSTPGFQFYLWPFNVLEQAPFAERAHACTDVADVVVIATDDDSELPESFRTWLETWQQRRSNQPDRLLALFHAQAPDETPMSPTFRGIMEFAMTSGVGFIWRGMPEEGSVEAGNGQASTTS